MTSSAPSSRDTIILAVGLFAMLLIGGWWLYQNIHAKVFQDTASSDLIPHHDFNLASTEELKKILFSGSSEGTNQRKTRVLDARPGSLWSEDHVVGSESLTPEDAKRSFEPSADELASYWIVLGDTRERARSLADILVDRGIGVDKVTLYDGTFSTWKAETGLTITPGNPSVLSDISKVKLLSLSEANAALQKGAFRKVIDVRSPQTFSSGHIPNAVNIPFSDLERRRGELSTLSSTLVYGGTDLESFQTGTLFFDFGIFSASTLSDGFDAWKDAGFPIEK